MAEPIKISLRYAGPSVENGEMDIDDVSEALKGFSGAYTKIVSRLTPGVTHQVRIAALKSGSFDVIITALGVLTAAGNVRELVDTVTSAAKFVFQTITYVINLKKGTKGQPWTFSVKGDGNNVTILTADHVELYCPPEAVEIFREKLIDGDLNKIANPLSPNRVDVAELREEGNDSASATITSADREYFRPTSIATKTEAEFIGNLVSLNKKTNRGTFEFNDSKSCRYHFSGENEDTFRMVFSRKGPVKAVAIVEFDENLNPLSMEIKSVEALQGVLPFDQK